MGAQYRYVGGPVVCAEDGSPVRWQKANEKGEFGSLRAKAENCGRR